MTRNLLAEYKKLTSEYISFKSVSTLNSVEQIEAVVDWLDRLFVGNGFSTKIIRGFDNPVLLTQKSFNNNYPTVLIYGHYDVQPASKEEWGSDPFKVREKNGRLYARGIVDNKGQMLVHLVSVLELIKTKNIKYNIKFLIEGNEETGSPNIGKLLRKYKKELKSDVILISDSAMLKNHPTLEMSLRGVFNTALTITTSSKDLHSGLFGGAVPNSAHISSQFISNLFNDKGEVLIDGFYDDVVSPARQVFKLSKQIPISQKEFNELTGAKKMLLEKGQGFYSQIGTRPTLQVTGFESGYTGLGYRNSIPSKTIIKFNIRLVQNQKPDKILELFKKFTKKVLPEYVDFEFAKPEKTEGTVKPIMLDLNNQFTQKAKELLKQVYKKEVFYDFNGATLPIVVDFVNILKTDMTMVALANEDCNMHAVDENFDLQSLEKALKFSYKLLSS